jgi:small subunit ribosomal protein S1
VEREVSPPESKQDADRAIIDTHPPKAPASADPGTRAAPDGWDTADESWHGGTNNAAPDWDEAARLFESKERVDLEVIGCNRGGLLVQFGGGLLVQFGQIQGFVPASQLIELPRELNSQARQMELNGRVGQALCLRVIELDRSRNRLILSERAAVYEHEAKDLLKSLNKGDVCKGHVTSLCGFGAFVDLGGVEGLIHISELSWGRVNHPGEVVNPGEDVEVFVMGVEPEQHRVALSLKRLKPDPWTLVDERYEIGQIIEAEITNVVSFGAFARVAEGLEGLIHVSELAEGNFLHPRNVVNEGERVKACILNIDSANHRLGLSLRQVSNHNDYHPYLP